MYQFNFSPSIFLFQGGSAMVRGRWNNAVFIWVCLYGCNGADPPNNRAKAIYGYKNPF